MISSGRIVRIKHICHLDADFTSHRRKTNGSELLTDMWWVVGNVISLFDTIYRILTHLDFFVLKDGYRPNGEITLGNIEASIVKSKL